MEIDSLSPRPVLQILAEGGRSGRFVEEEIGI